MGHHSELSPVGWNGAQSGLNASLDSKYRETMEIRTKHFKAVSETRLEGIKATEIGVKEKTK